MSSARNFFLIVGFALIVLSFGMAATTVGELLAQENISPRESAHTGIGSMAAFFYGTLSAGCALCWPKPRQPKV